MSDQILELLIDDEGNLVLPISTKVLNKLAASSIVIKFLAENISAYVLAQSGEILAQKEIPLPNHTMPELDRLALVAQSSLGFWDNPIDDEVWNDA
jgi:hypothetical protein